MRQIGKCVIARDFWNITMLSGSTVTTARRVLGLLIEETASRYGGKLRIY
jgi:hypothetical protein